MAARSEEASDAGDEHGPVSKAQPASKPHSEPVFIDMTEVDEGCGFFVNPPPRSTPHALVPSAGDDGGAVVARGSAEPDLIQRALKVLESRMRAVGPLLCNPQAVRDYLVCGSPTWNTRFSSFYFSMLSIA